MTYATLMVHLELGHANSGLLQIAGDLAERFHSRIVGIAAGQAYSVLYDQSCRGGDIIEQDFVRLEEEIACAESEFRVALGKRRSPIGWRSRKMFGANSSYLASEARCADLFMTGISDGRHNMNAGEIVMQLGRPVLAVPENTDCLILQQVVVCWKDTREARRAILDAMPFLKQAAHVDVVEVTVEDDLAASRRRLDDVVAWLKQHGVEASASASVSTEDDKGQLDAIFGDRQADLVVAGAYGHSRLQEWVLGGVSRDLLVRSDRCALVSH